MLVDCIQLKSAFYPSHLNPKLPNLDMVVAVNLM